MTSPRSTSSTDAAVVAQSAVDAPQSNHPSLAPGNATASDPQHVQHVQHKRRKQRKQARSGLTLKQVGEAIPLALKKMDPRSLYKTPVMFLVGGG